MPTLTVLYGPPADPDHFRRHYEETHMPLVRKLPGVRDLRYDLDVITLAGDRPVFAVFHATFDSMEALEAALASPEGQATQADVPNYADGGVTILVERD